MFSDEISHRLQKENKTKNKRSEINIRSRHNPTKIIQVTRVLVLFIPINVGKRNIISWYEVNSKQLTM